MPARLLPVLTVVLTVLLRSAPASHAQPARSGVVSGRVVDAETGAPLPGAHVFFSTTLRGTVTDSAGRFSFRAGAPVGAQRLQASMMGYEATTLDTLLQRDRRYRVRLRLRPTVIEAAAVTVTAERDEEWRDHLDRFEDLFIGSTPGADSVTIQNPAVLSFRDNWWGKLWAEAEGPVVFENRALGYRLRYHLKAFEGTRRKLEWDGEPLFEKLTPADSTEAARWQRNRRRAFYGSLRHFLLALLGDSLSESGFIARRLPTRPSRPSPFQRGFHVSASRLLERPPPAARDTLPAGTRLLAFHGRLRITYTRENAAPAFAHSPYRLSDRLSRAQVSLLWLDDGPVTVDPAGEIIEPYGAVVSGYFAFERLAVLLPKEYRP